MLVLMESAGIRPYFSITLIISCGFDVMGSVMNNFSTGSMSFLISFMSLSFLFASNCLILF